MKINAEFPRSGVGCREQQRGESKSRGEGRSGVVGTLLLVLNLKKYVWGGVVEHVHTWESVRVTLWELDLSNHHVISWEYTQVSSVEDTAV